MRKFSLIFPPKNFLIIFFHTWDEKFPTSLVKNVILKAILVNLSVLKYVQKIKKY